jgi:hypothetical protein
MSVMRLKIIGLLLLLLAAGAGGFVVLSQSRSALPVGYSVQIQQPSELITIQDSRRSYKLYHEVDYTHTSICDFSGFPPTLSKFRDVDIEIDFIPLDMFAEAKLSEQFAYRLAEPYYNTENPDVVMQLQTKTIGSQEFKRTFTGSEGCIRNFYLKKIAGHGVLVIAHDRIEELEGAYVNETEQERILKEYSAIAGVISDKEQRERLFVDLVESIEIYKGSELIFN